MPGGGIEFACEKPKEHDAPENVLKALQNMETNEEKLATLCKKYSELLDEHRTMQNTIKQNQRAITVLTREKDQLQSEHSKAVLAKSRLEGLCRELQKHNKIIKDESAARAKDDEEKRKEISTRFQTTINEIQQQMNDHYQKNTSLREENLDLANKLKGLIEQYELREANIDKILKTKEIEGQLYDAKLQQAALQLAEEKERSLQEKQKLLQEVMEAQKRIVLLEQQEEQLKLQLNLYSEKYEDFQSTLTKSSSVFESFKSEMEKMTKKIKKLEKETATWRQKWESSNKALLTLAEEKALSQKEVSLLQNKVGKLESLCRALQEERRKFTAATDSSEGRTPSKSAEAPISPVQDGSSLVSDPSTTNATIPSLNAEQVTAGIECAKNNSASTTTDDASTTNDEASIAGSADNEASATVESGDRIVKDSVCSSEAATTVVEPSVPVDNSLQSSSSSEALVKEETAVNSDQKTGENSVCPPPSVV